MAEKFHPYPEAFPKEAVTELIAVARGVSTLDLGCQINAAYAVMGFGLAMVPHSHGFGGVVVTDLATTLETLLAEGDGLKAEAFPWPVLIPIITSLIQQLLEKWLKK